jgi:ribonuclease T2
LRNLAALLLILCCTFAARAQDRPGDFDFYVLALSWSPSYCEAEGDRRRDQQCSRPFAFVVHGLWPQRERGYPADCTYAGGRLPQALIDAQLDIYPAPGLVVHEWRKHGTCSGLGPAAYFAAARTANAKIIVPDAFQRLDKPQFVDVDAVEKAFLAANPTLGEDAIAISCDSRRLTEIRVCLTKSLTEFRPCPEVDRQSCRRQRVFMPAVRGG